MSVLTDAMLDAVSLLGLAAYDNLSSIAAGSSNLTGTATRLNYQVNRFTIAPSTGVAVLPSLLTGETSYPTVVINDGLNAITVYAYADVGGHAEKINGVAATFSGATGGLSVAAGAAAIFIPEDSPKGRKGVATANSLNWSAAAFT